MATKKNVTVENTVEAVVEKILDARVDTRSNDDILYMLLCEKYYEGASSMTFKDFAAERKGLTCPSYASVTRARRKVFGNRPELNPKKTKEARKKEEKAYREYALGV